MSSSVHIQLNEGPVISLQALNQSFTYECLLEGVPTTELNRDLKAGAISDARLFKNDTPFLVSPVETPIHTPKPYPFGVTAKIPAVQCVSRWKGPMETRGDEVGQAELTIIWYQEEMALPIAPEAVAQIQAVEWSRHATFYEL